MNKTAELHARNIHTQGYTLFNNAIAPGVLKSAREAFDRIIEDESHIGPARGWHNKSYKISYALPIKDNIFRSLCLNEKLLQVMRNLLGKHCYLGALNGMTMTPNGETQALHIDQNEAISPGNILRINALHMLDDWKKENGCTRIIPGSQHQAWSHNMDMAAYEDKSTYIEAPAGSILAFNAALWHAGSSNHTTLPRRAIHALFMQPWIQPQWDFKKCFSPETIASLSEKEKQLFGFYQQPGWFNHETNELVDPLI